MAKKIDKTIGAGMNCLDTIKILKYEVERRKSERLKKLVDELYTKYEYVLSLVDRKTFNATKRGR